MWQINEVLRFDEQPYRILAVHPGELVWIQIDSDKGFPEFILELKLISYLDEGRLLRSTDPYAFLHDEEPEVGSVAFNRREKALTIIQPIIVDELCFETKARARRVTEVEMAGVATKATIYKLLRRFWQRGQKPNALLPDFKNSGAPGKSRAASGTTKVGRSRLYGDGSGIKVTVDVERIFRVSIEKHLLTQKKLQTTVAYRRFRDLFAQYHPEVLPEDFPTLRQFRYFYNREYKKPQRLLESTNPGIYKKDIRPLTSTATAHVLGPGSRYEIDATIADIYLVADDDRSKIIGRPTLYVVIDVFSRMIAGFYIGFDNPSYVVAMQAVAIACTEKVTSCKSLGIDITPDEWPCVGLPDVILADRGEMMSHQVDALIKGFNLRVESAPPRRGDAKGIVESCFRTLQAEFKPYVPGVVTGNRVKKHGERDYRLDAVMTITDFAQIMLKTILFRNNYHVMDKYDRDADLPADIPSIPIHLWNWGMQHRVGSLRQVDSEQLRIALLPRQKVSISQYGANMWGIYYSCPEFLREGWLLRSPEIQRSQKLEAAYNPGSADTIYLFPQPGSRTYWTCTLTDRSRQFRGLTFWQAWELQAQQKHNMANARLDEDAKRRELDAFIKEKTTSAIRATPAIKESGQKRIAQIRGNKKEAREAEQLQRASPANEVKDKALAQVIPLREAEEDYSLPNYVPDLFGDQDGEPE